MGNIWQIWEEKEEDDMKRFFFECERCQRKFVSGSEEATCPGCGGQDLRQIEPIRYPFGGEICRWARTAAREFYSY